LLTRVTQRKRKQLTAFVGVDAGFNSLLRPALYQSHHEIVNLTRLPAHLSGEESVRTVEVVGPICETGDVLGHARQLPAGTDEGDILLVATAGAYGHCMGSEYNLREVAKEHVLSDE
jgi:bifunctional diaminopimelate decarboxylase / aspartate kinase